MFILLKGVVTKQRLIPGIRADNVTAEDLGSGEVKVTIKPLNCGFNIPLIGALHSQVRYRKNIETCHFLMTDFIYFNIYYRFISASFRNLEVHLKPVIPAVPGLLVLHGPQRKYNGRLNPSLGHSLSPSKEILSQVSFVYTNYCQLCNCY